MMQHLTRFRSATALQAFNVQRPTLNAQRLTLNAERESTFGHWMLDVERWTFPYVA
jgi:hypothetical protein